MIRKKKIVIVGAGEVSSAMTLANRGCDVTAIEIAGVIIA